MFHLLEAQFVDKGRLVYFNSLAIRKRQVPQSGTGGMYSSVTYRHALCMSGRPHMILVVQFDGLSIPWDMFVKSLLLQ